MLRKSYLKEPPPQPIMTIVFYSLKKFGYFTYITTISDIYKLTDQKKFESLLPVFMTLVPASVKIEL